MPPATTTRTNQTLAATRKRHIMHAQPDLTPQPADSAFTTFAFILRPTPRYAVNAPVMSPPPREGGLVARQRLRFAALLQAAMKIRRSKSPSTPKQRRPPHSSIVYALPPPEHEALSSMAARRRPRHAVFHGLIADVQRNHAIYTPSPYRHSRKQNADPVRHAHRDDNSGAQCSSAD